MSDQRLAHNKKKISRKELLKMINELESQICIEGYSAVLNWKESLGFGRDDEHDDKKYSK